MGLDEFKIVNSKERSGRSCACHTYKL